MPVLKFSKVTCFLASSGSPAHLTSISRGTALPTSYSYKWMYFFGPMYFPTWAQLSSLKKPSLCWSKSGGRLDPTQCIESVSAYTKSSPNESAFLMILLLAYAVMNIAMGRYDSPVEGTASSKSSAPSSPIEGTLDMRSICWPNFP